MRIIPILILMIPLVGKSQFNILNLAENYTNVENGGDYLAPMNDIFSSYLHTAVFPRYSDKGFHIKLGFTGMRLNMTSNMKTYRGRTENFEEDIFADVPTIVGSSEVKEINSSEGSTYTFPGGLAINNLTLAIPELYIGTLLGTDVYGRYLWIPLSGELTNLTLYGGGIRHDFGRYFLPEYVKWYLSYSYHSANLGAKLSSINQYALTQLGVQLNRIGFYGLIGYELNQMEMEIIENSSGSIRVLNIYENSPFRFGGGMNLTFKYFDFYGEYSMADPVSISVGFSVGI